jgi:hypothetical protein
MGAGAGGGDRVTNQLGFVRRDVEGAGGNREVPPFWLLGMRGDLSGARPEAYMEREGGSWGKQGFPHGREPEANDVRTDEWARAREAATA